MVDRIDAVLICILFSWRGISLHAGGKVRLAALVTAVVCLSMWQVCACLALRVFDFKPVPSEQAGVSVGASVDTPTQIGSAFVRSSFVSSTRPSTSCETLRIYLERLVHVYCHASGDDKDAKIQALKSQYGPLFERDLPGNILREVRTYERICECLGERRLHGVSLWEIHDRGLCGEMSTKRKRQEILDICKNGGGVSLSK